MKQILEFADVSDVNMEEGSLRVDANISIRRFGDTALGTKTEVKNMNSFSSVVRALEVEFARQCAVVDAGGRIEQQTMLWDDRAGQVRPARSKEGSHDYRYFPEPDLPPLVIAHDAHRGDFRDASRASRSAAARDTAPNIPALTEYDIEVLTASAAMGEYFEQVARQSADPTTAANWMMGEVLAAGNATGQSIGHFTGATGRSRGSPRNGARQRREPQRSQESVRDDGQDG